MWYIITTVVCLQHRYWSILSVSRVIWGSDNNAASSSALSFTGMKNSERLEVSHGHVCPLAVQPVCLCSAHRRSGRQKKDRLKINWHPPPAEKQKTKPTNRRRGQRRGCFWSLFTLSDSLFLSLSFSRFPCSISVSVSSFWPERRSCPSLEKSFICMWKWGLPQIRREGKRRSETKGLLRGVRFRTVLRSSFLS